MPRRLASQKSTVGTERTSSSFPESQRPTVLNPREPATGDKSPPPLAQGGISNQIRCVIQDLIRYQPIPDGNARRGLNICRDTKVTDERRPRDSRPPPQQSTVATPTPPQQQPAVAAPTPLVNKAKSEISFPVNETKVILPKSPPPSLVLAVINNESGFNPDAASDKDCVGLMQISKKVATLYKCENRTDPQQNINAGAAYL